jgi:transcriptional regulator
MGLDAHRPRRHFPIVYRWDARMARSGKSSEIFPGTLDLLILRALRGGSLHGYGIAERLRAVSNDVLRVGESSLYPALQRLLLDGSVRAEWGASENNRRARFYTLTPAGRKQLVTEQEEFERMIGAIRAVLRFA